ncbi:MAG: 1,4-dihydroxy-2-naphthoate octaprenyltransferase [Candidatus Krumholzibacteria bacterium]|nr:1,4-dihydroxy-2-naphthoate octaprenyltransferase [Candidatus Krumholzibacteria bacterium]
MIKPSILFKELRAEFLPASVMPVFLGAAIAYARRGAIEPLLFGLTLAGVALIHVGANVINDYFDDLSGNDPLNTQFVRPFTGGSRLIQDRLLSPRAVLTLAIVLFAAAIAVGAVLTAVRGPYIILLGAIGIASAVFYVAPPLNLAGRGFGEFFIGLNFGVLITTGAHFVQARSVSWECVLASLPLAILIAAVVFINEFQDMNADARVGKRTLVVRVGLRKASEIYGVMMLSAFVPAIIGAATGIMPRTTFLALGALPFALRAIAIARRKYGSPKELAPANALTIATYVLVGVLLATGYLAAR